MGERAKKIWPFRYINKGLRNSKLVYRIKIMTNKIGHNLGMRKKKEEDFKKKNI